MHEHMRLMHLMHTRPMHQHMHLMHNSFVFSRAHALDAQFIRLLSLRTLTPFSPLLFSLSCSSLPTVCILRATSHQSGSSVCLGGPCAMASVSASNKRVKTCQINHSCGTCNKMLVCLLFLPHVRARVYARARV